MSYQQPDLSSSFRAHDLGQSIYDTVLALSPHNVLEIGALYGYSSHAIVQALSALPWDTTLTTVDLFEDYPFKCCDRASYEHNVQSILHKSPSVSHIVHQFDALRSFEILSSLSIDVDAVFIDISNDGEKLLRLLPLFSCPVLFEGGSAERDQIDWMAKYDRPPIRSLAENGFPYTIINADFPSLSLYTP